MNWKNCAIEDLREYESLKTACKNMSEQLKNARQKKKMLEAVNAAESNDSFLNSIVEYALISENLKLAKRRIKSIELSLSRLSEEERVVLQEFFMQKQPRTSELLCEKLSCEQAHVYRKRAAALYKFTLAQYGNLDVRF
jgi:ribosomal protein S8